MYSIGLEQDFIFIHIPKTGGTSVKDCLIRNYPEENFDSDRDLESTEDSSEEIELISVSEKEFEKEYEVK